MTMSMGARPLSAADLRNRRAITTLLPDRLDPDQLRQIARVAIGAAVAAGATYADIRVGDRRQLLINELGALTYGNLSFDRSYGVRVLVDGAWGFGYGMDHTPAGITATVESIVAHAKRLPKAVRMVRAEMPTVPVATGTWDTPVRIDPFALSVDDHVAMMIAYKRAVSRVRGANFAVAFWWQGEARVFASSEGALTTQSFMWAMPTIAGLVQTSNPNTFESELWTAPGFVIGSAAAGFEMTEGPDIQEAFKQVAEESVRFARYPELSHFPVGRYNAVLDGMAAGGLLGSTVVQALSLDRALGLLRSADADSFLQPVNSTFGTQVFSPLLSLTLDRNAPSLGAARWDDEGVATRSFPIVAKGVVQGYFGTRRATAWLAEQGSSIPSMAMLSGSAVASSPGSNPVGLGTCVRMVPVTGGPTLDDMIRDLGTGILIRSGLNGASVDTRLGYGVANPYQVYEVKQGAITRRIVGAGFPFGTKKLWQNIIAIGSSQTVQSSLSYARVGLTGAPMYIQVHAPAVHVRGMTVTDQRTNWG